MKQLNPRHALSKCIEDPEEEGKNCALLAMDQFHQTDWQSNIV